MIELSTMKRHDGCRHPGVRFRVKFLCNGAPQHVAQTGGQIVACVKARRANPICVQANNINPFGFPWRCVEAARAELTGRYSKSVNFSC